MGGSKITTKLGSSVSNGTLWMTAWAFLMLQPFSSADALFCVFLLHSPSVLVHTGVFQASTSPIKFFWSCSTDSRVFVGDGQRLHQLIKLLFPYKSVIKIASLVYVSLGNRQYHSRALFEGKAKPGKHRNRVFMSSSKNSQADRLS